jgi:thiamine biosynthesis lipoprotein
MKETRIIMGMPITVEIADTSATSDVLEKVFAYFVAVDERFSTYKKDSEIMRINRGEISEKDYSPDMVEVLALAEKTKKESEGYFDIKKLDGSLDPSGVVKGWAIQQAAEKLFDMGHSNFYIDAGGDIQSHGVNLKGEVWSVGIRSPFKLNEIVKIIYPHGSGVATSGTYVRGQHIYNPHLPGKELHDIVSLTVIGPDVLEADRLATGAFAMGTEGIKFIEGLSGFEAYSIDAKGIATMTSGFGKYANK